MNRFSPVALLLAACLASTVALAASDRVVAPFQDVLGLTTISGEARLDPMVQGGTRIHVNLEGLESNTDYVLFIYSAGGCASGIPVQIESFTSNPAGRFNLNRLVTQEISEIGSISVQLASDLSLQACATP